MKPEIKAQWVAALRSGEYKQGERRLRTKDQFCCLGVLCDLHAKATDGAWNLDQRGIGVYNDAVSMLPGDVISWAGLDRNDPIVMMDNHGRELSCLNDIEKLPFPAIADLIEEQL